MSNEETSITEEVGGELEREQLDALRADIRKQKDEERAAMVQTLRNELAAVAARTDTPEQLRVEKAINAVPDVPVNEKISYGSGARVVPASMSDTRYFGLPIWQREIRTRDNDYAVWQYFSAIRNVVKDGGQALRAIMAQDKQARATLDIGGSGGTDGVFDGTAGEAVPLPVANYVNQAFYRAARFMALSRRFTGSESMRVPLQSTVAASAHKAESAAIVQGEGSVSDHVNLVLQKNSNLAKLSNELLDNANGAFGVVQWLIDDVISEMAEVEDVKLYATGLGSSSNEPRGFELEEVVGANTSNTAIVPTPTQTTASDYSVTTLIDAADIRRLFYSLPEKERRSAIWAGPDQVMLALSDVSDANGRAIYSDANDPSKVVGDAAAMGATGVIHGRPVFNLPGAEAELDSDPESDTNRLYFFNPTRTYATLERPGIQVDVSTDSDFANDMTAYRFIRRYDGATIGNQIAARKQYRFLGGINGAS